VGNEFDLTAVGDFDELLGYPRTSGGIPHRFEHLAVWEPEGADFPLAAATAYAEAPADDDPAAAAAARYFSATPPYAVRDPLGGPGRLERVAARAKTSCYLVDTTTLAIVALWVDGTPPPGGVSTVGRATPTIRKAIVATGDHGKSGYRGQKRGTSTHPRLEFLAIICFEENTGPCFDNLKRDNHSSKDELK